MSTVPDRLEHEPAEAGPVHASYTNVLSVAWRHKSLLLLGGVVGVVIGVLYYSRQPPVYSSSSQLMVIRKGSPVPTPADDQRAYMIDDYLATQQILIRSPKVLQLAAKKEKIQDIRTLRNSNHPAGVIASGLSVAREPGRDANSSTNVLNLSYSGSDAEDCPLILNLVVEAYKEYLNEAFKSNNSEIMRQMVSMTEKLKAEYDEKYQKLRQFRLDNPSFVSAGEGRSVEEMGLSQLRLKRFQALTKKFDLEARIQKLDEAQKNGTGRQELITQLQNETRVGPMGLDNRYLLTDKIFDLDQQRLLLEVDGYGPQHPEMVKLDRRKAALLEYFDGRDKSLKDGQNNLDPIKAYVKQLQHELWKISIEVESTERMIGEEEKVATDIARLQIEDKDLREDLAKIDRMFQPLEEMRHKAELTQDIGGFGAELIAPPGTGYQIAPVPSRILMTAAFLGLCGGFVLAYLVDVMDKSFRTPDEIRRRLGVTVIGHIPVILSDQAPVEEPAEGGELVLDPRLCTYYQSKSFHAEAFRGLRTALYFSTQGEVHKVIQITSPQASDGKSTLVANLAISIAQSGRKVVLIDADLRKPRLHKMFGVPATVGLASIIAQEAELKDAVQPTLVPGLSIIPCGPRPSNPAELLTSPVFKEFVDAVREEFDYVLIDTPPLLAVSDPSVVAPRVDGVILAIRVSKNGRPNAERAKEILNTLGANVLGVVVNGAGPRGGGGGYGGYGYDSYRYNYGYAYNYSYDYSYSYDTYSGYYDDEDGDGAEGHGATERNGAATQTAEHAEEEPLPEVHRSPRKRRSSPKSSKDSGFLSRFWKRPN